MSWRLLLEFTVSIAYGVLSSLIPIFNSEIYIVASLAWLWGVEGLRPDRWDVAGAAICLVGATVIIAGPR